jgi:hypothetical protein
LDFSTGCKQEKSLPGTSARKESTSDYGKSAATLGFIRPSLYGHLKHRSSEATSPPE